MTYQIHLADCLEWAEQQSPNSIHSIVTDPPFGYKEYTKGEQRKLRAGQGGVWRIPPSFDGSNRRPLPRFTVLSDDDIQTLIGFFRQWGERMKRLLVPGGHIFVAANPILSQFVWMALIEAGLEKRGEIVRVVRTFRGGDRPKGAHKKFPRVCTMPRAAWEPWGLFRKPFEGRVADNLTKWKAGALKRISEEKPFVDVIESGRTPQAERQIAAHPSLKPQHFMRQLVRASLPLGEGIVLDPFMGGGSTVAAAEAVGYDSIGIEIDAQYFAIAQEAIPKLSCLQIEVSELGSSVNQEQDWSTLPLFASNQP